MTKLYSRQSAPVQIRSPDPTVTSYLSPFQPLYESAPHARLLRQDLSHPSNVRGKRSKNPVTQLSTSRHKLEVGPRIQYPRQLVPKSLRLPGRPMALSLDPVRSPRLAGLGDTGLARIRGQTSLDAGVRARLCVAPVPQY